MIDYVWCKLLWVKSIRCEVFPMSILFSWTRSQRLHTTSKRKLKHEECLHFRHKLYLISMFVRFSFFCCGFGLFRAGRITIQFLANRQNMFVSRAQFYFVIFHISRLVSIHVIIIYFFTNHQIFLTDTISSNRKQSYFSRETCDFNSVQSTTNTNYK